VDKEKFVEALNDFVSDFFERERMLKDKIDPIDAPPKIKMMVRTAEMQEFSRFIAPHLGAIVMSSGLDPEEFAMLSYEQHKKREVKNRAHAEWYRKQEFDV
jgi:hypothetical protein